MFFFIGFAPENYNLLGRRSLIDPVSSYFPSDSFRENKSHLVPKIKTPLCVILSWLCQGKELTYSLTERTVLSLLRTINVFTVYLRTRSAHHVQPCCSVTVPEMFALLVYASVHDGFWNVQEIYQNVYVALRTVRELNKNVWLAYSEVQYLDLYT